MSDLRVNTISASDGTSPVTLTKQIAQKSYWRLDQIGSTLDDSFGVSSTSDSATGIWVINTINSFDSNHFGISSAGTNWHTYFSTTTTASSVTQVAGNSSHTSVDALIYGSLTGDLA